MNDSNRQISVLGGLRVIAIAGILLGLGSLVSCASKPDASEPRYFSLGGVTQYVPADVRR